MDAGPKTNSILPFASDCEQNQVFFESTNLTQDTNHVLTIQVESASPSAPYILDYMIICGLNPNANHSGNNTNDTDTSSPATSQSERSHTEAIVVGSVLGSLLLLTIIGFTLWLVIRRRRRQRGLRKLHIAASPVASWLHWNSDRSSE